MRADGKRATAGTAVLEVSLLAPWIFFLFVGVLDFGFYAYALISTENAARAAALYTASSDKAADDSATACQYALGELRALPNMGASVTSCSALPLQVAAQRLDATQSANGSPATRVTVTYQTIQMIPLPFLAGQFTITRVVEMPINPWSA